MAIDINSTLSWASKESESIFTNEVTFFNNNSNKLIITCGDSWTYGDSLDDRLNEIFGMELAKQFNSDLLNIGFRGFGNSFILNFVNKIIKDNIENLKKYDSVDLVITLTENATDVTGHHSFPFDYISHYNKTNSNFYASVLEKMEDNWVYLLEKIAKHKFLNKIVIGQNFIWHENILNKLSKRFTKTDKNWIEVISENANYELPVRTTLVTGWIFDEFKQVNGIIELKNDSKFKEFVIPFIDKANQVNKWLDDSAYNGEKGSKHPNKTGHIWWAEYLINYLKNE